jgi:hypothetical protein
MAKFYGPVGYGESVEDPPGSGVYVDQITEVFYYGDILREARTLEPKNQVNDDISVGNRISIVADEWAIEHFSSIKYVKWAGTLWTVTTVEVKSPRLLLSLGSVYNGPTP